MERMTIRNSDGSVSQPTDLKWAEALERLSAYEDTGLEPEEVRGIKTAYDECQLPYEVVATGADAVRVIKFLEAEDEGRLLILPCKVGDTVYCIRKNPFAKGRYVKENIAESITVYRDNRISIFSTLEDVLGKTVFLTREEAEAALRGGADG